MYYLLFIIPFVFIIILLREWISRYFFYIKLKHTKNIKILYKFNHQKYGVDYIIVSNNKFSLVTYFVVKKKRSKLVFSQPTNYEYQTFHLKDFRHQNPIIENMNRNDLSQEVEKIVKIVVEKYMGYTYEGRVWVFNKKCLGVFRKEENNWIYIGSGEMLFDNKIFNKKSLFFFEIMNEPYSFDLKELKSMKKQINKRIKMIIKQKTVH